MAQQYNSYAQAEDAAIELSVKSPGFVHFVSWVEDNVFEVSIFEDYPDQPGYLNGFKLLSASDPYVSPSTEGY